MKTRLVIALVVILWLALVLGLAFSPSPETKAKTATTKVDLTTCPTRVKVIITQPGGMNSEVYYATSAYWTGNGQVVSLNLGMTKCRRTDIRPRADERVEIKELP